MKNLQTLKLFYCGYKIVGRSRYDFANQLSREFKKLRHLFGRPLDSLNSMQSQQKMQAGCND